MIKIREKVSSFCKRSSSKVGIRLTEHTRPGNAREKRDPFRGQRAALSKRKLGLDSTAEERQTDREPETEPTPEDKQAPEINK